MQSVGGSGGDVLRLESQDFCAEELEEEFDRQLLMVLSGVNEMLLNFLKAMESQGFVCARSLSIVCEIRVIVNHDIQWKF